MKPIFRVELYIVKCNGDYTNSVPHGILKEFDSEEKAEEYIKKVNKK